MLNVNELAKKIVVGELLTHVLLVEKNTNNGIIGQKNCSWRIADARVVGGKKTPTTALIRFSK